MRARAFAWIRGVSRAVARATGLFVALGALMGCAPRDTAAPRESAAATSSSTERAPTLSGAAESPRQRIAAATSQTSASCLECHREIHAGWADSAHALANRPRAAVPDAEGALATFPTDAGAAPATVDLILGHLPAWQPLVPRPGGRWQPHELAYDPVRKDWFSIFGDERRHEGEWGHWTGRGMNWNSMCAHCHMTGFTKGYDAATDTFHSKWVEHGVGCIQCHGPTGPDHGRPSAAGTATVSAHAPFHGDRGLMMQTCAPCHARNEPLTADFQPGDSYHDHFRVTLPVEPGIFHPDGQQRDEDFNWTSVLLSRMGHAGVTCLDCHDPHTNRPILPVENNALCLQCHAPPGRVQPNGTRAVPIDPTAHSRHAAGSVGNQCVSCHMPTTTYMQRSPRHDHGWLKPDPLLTKELGIPNACNGCHTDRPVEWAIAQTDAWYGEKMESRQRARARAVAAAQAGRPEAAGRLLDILAVEDVPAWRATCLQLLAPLASGAEGTRIVAAAEASLAAKDPLERAAAVQVLGAMDTTRERVRPLLADPTRLVRLDAAWALSAELPAESAARAELDAYLRLSLEQPSGRLRLGQDLANRGRLVEAEQEMRRATEWDPYSAGLHEAHAFVLSAMGRPLQAAAKFYRAAQQRAGDGTAALRAALAYAEAGRPAEAETSLRMAVEREPSLHRAWYNLGLLLAQSQRLPEAAEALARAEQVAPREADYPYALATVRLRQGDRAAAVAAAERVLALDPAYPGARDVLQAARR
jgi:predicted CXXCH cytochrome family protein